MPSESSDRSVSQLSREKGKRDQFQQSRREINLIRKSKPPERLLQDAALR